MPPPPFAAKAGRCGTHRNQAQVSPPARQRCADSDASMPWSQMRSDPILSVSPSVTDGTPEMPAPAAPAADEDQGEEGGSRKH